MIFQKSKIHYLILFLSLCGEFPLIAQQATDPSQALELLQDENNLENPNFEDHLQNLEVLALHPININKADYHKLQQSGLFTTLQINSILSHIDDYGPLLSLYELQVIPHFNISFISSILPYITTASHIDDYHINFSKLIAKGDYEILLRYQQSFPNKVGFSDNSYLGHPSKLYLRYKYHYSNHLSYGITAEKDQGEPMFRGKNTLGFDFYSFHFFWRKNTKLSALAIGDYQMNLGQGLVLWTGFGFNKSLALGLNKKEGSSLRPFTSVNEYLFLRGFACTLNFKNWEVSPFISLKKIDANTQYNDSTNNDLESNRILINGYHRTRQEIANKNELLEFKTGTNIQFKTRKWHVGFNAMFTQFSKEIKFKERTYNSFQFQGSQLLNTSVDYHFLIKSFHFYGENAISINRNAIGFANLNGVLFTPNKHIDFTLIHRYYPKNYQTHYYHNSFGELTGPNGEHGIFLGTSINLSKSIKLSTYFDYYQLNWLKYQLKKPGSGYDCLVQFKHKISRQFEWYINFKLEEKDGNTKIQLGANDQFALNNSNKKYVEAYFGNLQDVSSLRPSAHLSKQTIEAATFITPILLHRIRLHLSYKPHKSWTLQTRLEYSYYNDKINQAQKGYLIYQDVRFNGINSPVGFSTRLSFFDIAQFNSRIYAYESDVLYQFSIPAIFNAGLRYYLNLNYKVSSWMQVWLRFSTTYYSDVSSKGTGNDEIPSNKNYDIKMQVRWKF